MTDLQKAVMNTENSDETPETIEEIMESEEDISEEYDTEEFDESEEELRKSTEEIEQLKKEVEIETQQLEIKFATVHVPNEPRPPRRRYHYIGTFSAAASLILMGIAMTISLFSPTGILTSLKVAPLMLVFLGVEIGMAIFINRSARIRYNLKSLILTLSLIVLSFVMSLISITNSSTGGERYYAEERLQNMLEKEISREISHDIVKDVVIEIHIYGDNPAEYDSIADLKDSDVIDLEIMFSNAQVTMYEFAGNCRKIMDSIYKLPYNFGTVNFIADDDINSYRLEINWLYQQDFSTTELIPLVNYFGNDIVMDIPDLADDE